MKVKGGFSIRELELYK